MRGPSLTVWVNDWFLPPRRLHLFRSYTRHFRQTVSHNLALVALPKGIQIDGTFASGARAHKGWFVNFGIFLTSIDTRALQEKNWV
jgi:hypothetical protein